MQTIYYANATFETDDEVAAAVLELAGQLASAGTCAVVDVPIILHGLPATARLLVGSGLPIAVQGGTALAEFEAYDIGIDPFEVRRAVNDIAGQLRRIRGRAAAHPVPAEWAVDHLWELTADEVSRSDGDDVSDPGDDPDDVGDNVTSISQ